MANKNNVDTVNTTTDAEIKEDVAKIDEEIKEAEESIAKSSKKIKAKGPNPNELVLLEIPISETLQDDWVAIINGKTFQVQRGEKVMVPRYVKEVYDNSVRQQRESFRRQQALQRAAESKKEALAFK